MTQHCQKCGGSHETYPTVQSAMPGAEIGAYCPHCGEWHGLGITDERDFESHPASPDGGTAECICQACNGAFKIRVR